MKRKSSGTLAEGRRGDRKLLPVPGTSVSVQIRVPMFFFKHTLEVTSTSKYDN